MTDHQSAQGEVRSDDQGRQQPGSHRASVIAWALYDWANSAFATSVLVGFFPLVFNQQWSDGARGSTITARLMTTNGLASLALMLCAPLLGAIADRGGLRKPLLAVFAVMGCLATAGLFWVPAGNWLVAALAFGLASFGFAAANVSYDAMLVDLGPEDQLEKISALGFAFGYAGGGLLFGIQLVSVLHPAWFSLTGPRQALQVAFPTVALWWFVFTLPLLLLVRDKRPRRRQPRGRIVVEGISQLWATARRIRQFKPVMLFLAAYWLYIDGVNTVMKAAVDFGYKLGVARHDLMIALLIVQGISLPATLGFGWLGGRIGPRQGLLIGLVVYVVVTLWAAGMSAAWEFYVLAGAIGLVQGGVFSLSRSLYARLIPADESAEFFGLYNMVGKFAAVLGPLLVAAAAAWTGSTRSAVAAILPLLLIGGLLLLAVPNARRRCGTP